MFFGLFGDDDSYYEKPPRQKNTDKKPVMLPLYVPIIVFLVFGMFLSGQTVAYLMFVSQLLSFAFLRYAIYGEKFNIPFRKKL